MTARAFVDACARHADATALDGEVVVSYAALARWSASIAASLRARGVRRGDVVAIDAGRSAAHVAAMLGAWRCGAAFLPIAREWPEARRVRVLDVAHARSVLDRATIEAARQARSADVPDVENAPDDLAYVIATSGSTGEPKLVALSHRGLAPLFAAQIDAFRLAPGARALWSLSPAFDASISDVGTTLLAGATLVVGDEDVLASAAGLRASLERHAITHADLPPSILRWLSPTASLRVVVIGGEPCPPEVVRRWARAVRVVNVYGPTESTVCASLCACDAETWDRPLLGAPIAGTRFHVLDEALAPVPVGTPGELCIAGEGLAIGYLGAPARTAEKFVDVRGERLYRTGDRVVARPEGGFEFLGRLDRQVKLRGRLVELAEVEHALAAHPSVSSAAALVVARGASSTLVAFVEGAADASTLRTHARALLPEWMIPARIELVASLPRTHAGKIDFAALRARTTRSSTRTPTSWTGDAAIVARAACDALGVDEVHPETPFVELADSIARIELVASAEAHGVALDPEAISRATTFAEVIASIGRASSSTSIASLEREVARAAASLEPKEIAADAPPDGAIVVTGATGNLGAFLLDAIASRTERPLVALVRASDLRSAERRLDEALASRGLSLARGRVRVVCGDVGRPRFGCDAWDELCEGASAIVHAAADVRLGAPFDALSVTNVEGTREAIRFAETGRRKILHHVSTLSVFTAVEPSIARACERDDVPRSGDVHGGYAQSKWVAEALVRSASRCEVAVHRLGLVVAPLSRGRGVGDDHLSRVIRGLASIGEAPKVTHALAFDLLPVDACADALATIVLAPARGRTCAYHYAHRTPATYDALLAAMRAEGVALEDVDPATFAERTARADGDASLARLSLAFRTSVPPRQRAFDLFEATDTTLDVVHTESMLGAPIVDAPCEAVLRRCVAAALGGAS